MKISVGSYFIAALLIVSAMGCGSSDKPIRKQHKKYDNILAKFKSISLDTLEVYSHGSDSGRYYGTPFDSVEEHMFPKEIYEEHVSSGPNIFAVYKFPIDEHHIGLIARTPAMYEPTSIKLFFFDKAGDSITSYIELAERWGDAGDSYVKRSWLYKDNNKLRAFVWNNTGYDHQVEDPNDTTVDSHDHYYILDLSKFKPDTLRSDSAWLAQQFSGLLKKAVKIW